MKVSARNVFKGTVAKAPVKRLKLKKGAAAYAIIKAPEVLIDTD